MISIRRQIIIFMLLRCTLLECAATKIFSIERIPCSDDVTASSEGCNSCINFDTSLTQKDLKSFQSWDIENILFNKTEDNLLSWTYGDVKNSTNPRNTTISLYVWDSITRRGRPVSNCCDIPLSNGSCVVDECRDGVLFAVVNNDDVRFATRVGYNAMTSCGPKRPSARYFNICSNRMTVWGSMYNCECVVYDSVSGELQPGNLTSYSKLEPTDNEVWYIETLPVEYEACLFSMPKDEVLRRGSLSEDSVVMDSVVFQRGVYYMKDYSGLNGSVVDERLLTTVNCTLMKFSGTELFNVSSSTFQDQDHFHDNDTFTCMSLWPDGTPEVSTEGTHVKCMPQNETFSLIYLPMDEEADNFLDMILMIVLPLSGAMVLAVLLSFVFCKVRKRVNKFIMDTKDVPEELESVMKKSLASSAPPNYYSVVYKEETCDKFDKEEKERVNYARNHYVKQIQKFEPIPNTDSQSARIADKRVQREDEYSDSEDEGEGGRKNQESHKKKRRKVEGGTDGKPAGLNPDSPAKAETKDDTKQSQNSTPADEVGAGESEKPASSDQALIETSQNKPADPDVPTAPPSETKKVENEEEKMEN